MSNSAATTLFKCVVHRRLTGVEFTIKAPRIEEVMRLVSGGTTRGDRDGFTWGANRFYQLPMGANGIPTAFPGFSAGRFDLWGAKELLLSRAPAINLSFLLAVGLESEAGATIAVPTVISDTALTSYTEGLKSAVRQFYIDFLRDSTRTITITTEEVTS